MRCKATKHHRMNSANARAREHRKTGFRNHWHVNQYTIAFANPIGLQNGGHAIHFSMQFFKGICLFNIGLGGNRYEGNLIATLGQMPINCVVAKIG